MKAKLNIQHLVPSVLFGLVILVTGAVGCATLRRAPSADTAHAKARVLSYGIFKRAEKEAIIKTPETPSGFTRIPAGNLTIAEITNRIPARIGVLFGVRYEVTDLELKDGEYLEITKVTTHPPMEKPDGNPSERFSFVERAPVKNGRIEAQTGYGFDHDYELVTGLWRIELKLNGKRMLTQEFTVFKE